MTTRDGKTFATWTLEEIAALNEFQALANIHPFTCPHNHGDKSRVLIARQDGWHCPNCDYTQDWAHQSMLQIGFEAAQKRTSAEADAPMYECPECGGDLADEGHMPWCERNAPTS